MRGSVNRFVVVLAVAAALLGTAAAARAADPPPPGQHHGQTGVMHVKAGGTGASPFAAPVKRTADYPGPLINHGGPVMATHTIYAIYWYPSGYTVDSAWKQLVDGYLSNVATASGATDNVYGVATQYGVHYDSVYGGSVVATDPFPTSGGCAFGGGNPCLNENQIEAEIKKVVADNSGFGWSADSGSPASHPTHLFMLYLPPNVADCFTDPFLGTVCSADSTNQYYCAYHGAFASGGQTYVFGNMPYSWSYSGCQSDQFPNNNTDADTAIDVTSHEWIEALTDPYLNAWYDGSSQGYEIADKCQFTYGTPLGQVGGQDYNQSISGGSYWTQLEYSNSLGDCAPVAPPAITSIPAPAHGGDAVDILGSAFYGPVVVKFNGIVANVDIGSSTPTDLKVEVPASGNPNGKITVQALGGKATSTQGFGIVPSVTSVTPNNGFAGSTVTVTGSGFFGVKSVKFGGVTGTFNTVASNGTTLKAVVPIAAISGYVTVTTAGGPSPDSEQYVVHPKIASFTPLAATGGSMVTINGSGLSSANEVDFNGFSSPSVDFAHGTATKLVAQVPDDTSFGPITVWVNAGTDSATSVANFKPLPKITSLDAYDGKAGNTIKVFGSNLTGGTVKFGTFVASTTGIPTATEIDATVPAGFSSGNVTVINPNGTATSPKPFAITKVTSFSPLAAAAGATVTVTGQGLGSTNAVDFAGHAAVTPTGTPTPTSVKVLVPNDATNGTLTIHTANSATASTLAVFKPVPKITSLDAYDGQAGNAVTITGTNLTGASTVKFGTISVAFGTVSATSIANAVVPGAPFSSGKVTIVTPGGTAVSSQTFAITKVTGIAPASAAAGSTVTITGQGLASTTSVDFGSHAGVAPSLAPTSTSVKVVVPGDATTAPLTVNTPRANPSTLVFKPLPKITSFSANPVHAGDLITIIGTNLEPDGSTLPSVKLGALTMSHGATDTQTSTQVIVPDAGLTGIVALSTLNGSTTAPTTLKVAPTISVGPTPSEGVAGDQVTLTGNTFSGTTSVKFSNGVAAPFTLTGTLGSPQTLTFHVPATAATGPITVTNAGGSSVSSAFTVDPKITSFSPTSAPDGATITVTGSGFGLGGDTRVVRVGSVTATSVTPVSPNSLKFVVPDGAPVQDKIHVQVNGGATADSATNLNVTATVASVTPGGAVAGTNPGITIDGAGFANVTDVKFGATSVGGVGHFTVNQAKTEITTTLPNGVSDGAVTVVRSSGGNLVSATTFKIVSVTDVSPTSAQGGDTLTITGTNLDSTSAVDFSGHSGVTPTSASATQVKVAVPGDAATGTLTLHTDFGTVDTASVTILPPSVSGFSVSSQTPNSVLFVFGTGFVDVTKVDIGATQITNGITVDSKTQLHVTIPGGTTTGAVKVVAGTGTSTEEQWVLVEHDNGLGQNYYSANAPSAFTYGDASSAANVWSAGSFSATTCAGAAVQVVTGSKAAVWVYQGPLAGRVFENDANNTPTCPSMTSPTWN